MQGLKTGLRTAATGALFLMLASASPADLPQSTATVDEDRDGVDDQLEQRLLEQFVPVFHLSDNDCDVRPAEFRPAAAHPEVLARNGTIYGQVFRRSSAQQPRELIEIHYYHLWGRDCGKSGHLLDVEHVSALVQADAKKGEQRIWRATLWYAGAHEGTVCDMSSAAKARDLGAEDRGPDIWISHGKHASYFSQSECAQGCGGDVCTGGPAFHPAKLVNIGEAGAWLNGAAWVGAGKWTMLAKMHTDFSDERMAMVGSNETWGVVLLNPGLHRTQAVLATSNSTLEAVSNSATKTGQAVAEAESATGSGLQAAGDATEEAGRATRDALSTSGTKTGNALSAASASTDKALGSSARATAKGLRTAIRSIGRALGIEGK